MQERKGVGQPVGELRVVIGVVLNRDGHLAHDAVKQTRALQLKHPPVQQRAERDARQDGLPAAEPDLAALLDGREEYLVVRLRPRVGERDTLGVELRLLPLELVVVPFPRG